MLNSKELISLLKSLKLPKNDFAIFGSGPMYPRGIKELNSDIDLIARGEAWERAKTLNNAEIKQSGTGYVVKLFDGAIEIFDSWTGENWDINELIDTADEFDDIKYVTLENVIKWKKQMAREKDFEHIRLIEEYLKKNDSSTKQAE